MLWQLSLGARCRTARTALYLHKAVPSARSHSHSKGYHSKRGETPSRPVWRKGIWMLMGIWTAPKPKYPWRVRNSRILQLHTSSSRHHRSDRATYRPLLVKMCLAKQTGIQTGSICRNGIGLWNVHEPHQQNPSNKVITVNNLTSVEIWQDFVVLSWFKRRIRVQPSGPSASEALCLCSEHSRTSAEQNNWILQEHCHERGHGAGLRCLWHHVEPLRSHHSTKPSAQLLPDHSLPAQGWPEHSPTATLPSLAPGGTQWCPEEVISTCLEHQWR